MRATFSAFVCVFTLVVLASPGWAVGEAGPDVSGELRQWHRATLTFRGPELREDAQPNPFRDFRLDVKFQHNESGESITVPGFFAADGDAANSGSNSGNCWRVHFLPTRTGKWSYSASFRTGKDVAISGDAQAGKRVALDGAAGEFIIRDSDKQGRDHRAKGLLRYVGEHYWQFAGTGEWFLKGGADSPENFLAYADFDDTYSAKREKNPKHGEALGTGLHQYRPHLRDWREGDPTWRGGKGKAFIGALNYLASEEMNSVYCLTMNITGDGDDVWPYARRDQRDRFDCSKLDQWEIVFSHMDARGIMLHVILQETENDQLLDGGRLGDQRKLYFRELIARFAHHPALVWNLGEENTNTDEQRKQFCQFIRRLDPYDHPIVCHTYPGKYDQVYKPLLGEEAFEGPSLQTNDTHHQTLRWRAMSAAAGRKWVVNLDEVGKADTGVKPDKDDPGHDEIRKQHLWGNLMAGGGGVEWYFGYKFAHNDLNCEDWRSRAVMWKQTRIALQFFQNHLPFSKMAPADGLTDARDDYVFTKPGEIYAIYLPHGGTTKLQLPDAAYSVMWYNPRDGGDLQTGTVASFKGTGKIDIGMPPSDVKRDWVALVTYAGDGEAPRVTLPKVAIPSGDADDQPARKLSADELAITGFTLVNADSDKPLQGFANVTGDVRISLSKMPTRNINVVAQVKSSKAGSVRFAFGGENNYRTESVAPFALEGDTSGDFNPWRLTIGQHAIAATAFSGTGGRGTKGTPAAVRLIVTE